MDKNRCSYCGMVVSDGLLGRLPDGTEVSFCNSTCSLRFELLGSVARLRADIVTRRASILDGLEAERGSKVLTLVHRREPWTTQQEDGHITIEDSEAVVAAIRHTPDERPIDLILHTPGGVALAAELIAMALKNHPGPTTVVVPFYAMSGGTLIALAADEILMDRESILGPVDPQINGFPAAAYLRLLEQKPIEAVSDQVVLLGEAAKRSIEGAREFVKWLLEGRLPRKEQDALAVFLTGGYIAHDTPIVLDTLREFGLPVKEGIPRGIEDLFRTFIFGACERPGAMNH